MPRVQLQPGEHGVIHLAAYPNGGYMASAYMRDATGRRTRVRATGPTKTVARARILERITARAAMGGGLLSPSSTIADVMDAWWPTVEESPDLKPQTIAQYRHYADIIRRDLGDLEIRHATAGRLNAYVADAARDPATGRPRRSVAKGLKLQLARICGWAVRRDLLPHNPARDIDIPTAANTPVVALTPAQVVELRAHVAGWCAAHPRSDTPLPAILDVMLGTGARISEVLALRWCDVDLAASPATVTIAGTLVVGAGPVHRQDVPKTAAGYRVMSLPVFATAALLELRMNARGGEPVFPSGAGTWRHPHNVRRTWRDCLGPQWAWVTPHVLRKTVATAIYAQMNGRDAAGQLGHADTGVTMRHYVKRAHVGPDATAVLEGLAHGEGSRSGPADRK